MHVSTLFARLTRLRRFLTAAVLVVGIQAVIVIGLIQLGLNPQIALATGVAISGLAHFGLNRQWVFTDEGHGFGFHISSQAALYIALFALNYAASAACLAVLPDRLGVSASVVYACTTVVLGLNNYFVLGRLIFKRGRVSTR